MASIESQNKYDNDMFDDKFDFNQRRIRYKL